MCRRDVTHLFLSVPYELMWFHQRSACGKLAAGAVGTALNTATSAWEGTKLKPEAHAPLFIITYMIGIASKQKLSI